MLLTPGDPRYPALLGVIASPPSVHVRGAIVAADGLAIAIVGSRRASTYGLEVAERLAFDLAARGVTIVSGLARGIDAAAHRGALAADGRTIAVLGCGIDVVYPPENARLMRQVEERGAVLSQFPPGTPPLPYNFPTRNRTLAGLALGVVVVEAGERSGALVTAGYAGDLGREVFAVPGRITAEESRGTNALLRDGGTGHWPASPWVSSSWRRASARGRSSPPGTRVISAAKCLPFQAESRPRKAAGRTPSFATGLYLLGTGQMSCKNCRICGVPRFVVLDTLETKARGRASRVRRAGSWRCYDQTSPSI